MLYVELVMKIHRVPAFEESPVTTKSSIIFVLALLVGSAFIAAPSIASGTALSAVKAELSVSTTQNVVPRTIQPPLSAWSNLKTYFSYQNSVAGAKCLQAVQVVSFDLRTCTYGDVKATRVAYLIGDSQAYQWLPAVDTWGLSQKWKVITLAKISCRPWPSSTYLLWDHKSAYPQCRVFNNWVVSQIVKNRPGLVLFTGEVGALTATTLESSSNIVSGITTFKQSVSAAKSRLVMIQNIPWFWGVPASPACLTSHLTQASICAQPRVAPPHTYDLLEKNISAAISQIQASKIALVLPVDDLMCSATMCPMVSRSILLYTDSSHITRAWAQHVTPAFSEMLKELVGP
jgi:hypothetical protein